MPKLVARSLDGDTAEVVLPAGSPGESTASLSIGRVAGCDLRLDFDNAVSRVHGSVRWEDGYAILDCHPKARNGFLLPHGSEPQRQVRLKRGDSAIIGRTQLTVESSLGDNERRDRAAGQRDDQENTSLRFATSTQAEPDEEFTITPLPAAKIADDGRLSVLSRLPSVLDSALDETERLSRVVSLILVGVKSANAASIVRRQGGVVHLLAWDRNGELAGEPSISSRLVSRAIDEDATVVHAWYGAQAADFTVAEDCDWTFATPIGRGYAIVVSGAGRGAHTTARQLDAKFVEVTAELLRTERENRELSGRIGQLRRFFSAPVMQTIEEAVAAGGVFESELLAPRECELAVLFCDLRGFSADVEQSENLLEELDRVREALGVMTQAVLDHGGVTGEFLGDAVLGFWGWPLESENKAIDCAAAALQIARTFGRDENGLAPHGIGLAVGRAVAGRIMTGDRTSINAFGPALNLASRLQTLTKQLRVPIVASQAFREQAAGLAASEGRFRLLGRVVPYGLKEPVDVSELALPHPAHTLSDDELNTYEVASCAFIAGDWRTAYRLLRSLPDDDRAADFLMPELLKHGRTPPPDWDGTLRMAAK